MRGKWLFSLGVIFFNGGVLLAQETTLRGKVLDPSTQQGIPDVEVSIANTDLLEMSDEEGHFLFHKASLPYGEGILVLRKYGYQEQYLPIVINEGKDLNLSVLYLQAEVDPLVKEMGVVRLSEEELDLDIGSASNISGLLGASKDVFLRAAAFDFSGAFYNPRGYDSKHGLLLINGVTMNKMLDARPLWSNWGGLNDVMREQLFSTGMSANEYTFGGLAGSTNIIMRASNYYKGGTISYASANASYRGRWMASYHTGLMPSGWAVSVLISRRFAKEGYKDASLYDANSIFTSFEKRINKKHSLNLTMFYTPNRRGKTSANTQEVYDLKNTAYNAYWGRQEGKKRNSRVREVEEPVFMLNHYWDFNHSSNLTTSIAYQFGKRGNSRLGFNKAANPDPTYYQNLPSYFLADAAYPNKTLASSAKEAFQEDGQIDWEAMYHANIVYDAAARYYLYQDRVDDKQLSFHSNFTKQIDRVTLNAAVEYRRLDSENYAYMLDLLGAESHLDIDNYSQGDAAQSDLHHPDRLIFLGDRFNYNYKLYAEQANIFLQTQFKFRKTEYYLAAEIGTAIYQREGLYKSGAFADNSYGKSQKQDFLTYGFKSGLTYKLTGRHILDFHLAYYTQAPNLQNSFSNSRKNNEIIKNITTEKNQTIELSYIYRSPFIQSRLTGYYTKMEDISQVSFFYADGISGLGRSTTTAFVQEVLTGVEKLHLGVEFGIEAQLTPSVKGKVAAGIGQYTYANNPNLYLTSDDFEQELEYGEAYLKNYKLSDGPQHAYQVGLEYRNPKYWWIGATANVFSNTYVNIAPIVRTKNFYMDSSGYPFVDYDETIARELLKQERFASYMLMNLVGGKSWKKGKYFISTFVSIHNVWDQQFRTGGFEQSRNANYRTLKTDMDNEIPVFGAKYWYGNGRTYYLNLSLRF